MKIIVVGCGKIGSSIIENLVAEGHDVVAVDHDPAIISSITNVYDVMGVCGGGADCDILSEAGVDKAELFITAAGSDELNMLSCYLAGKMGSAHTIARIRTPAYNDKSLNFMKQQLGLAMAINPELLTAHEIFNILKLPSAVKIETFSRRNFEMIEIVLKSNSPLNGMKLTDIRNKYKTNFLVCAVQRGEEVFIPDGNFELHHGDKIGITATHMEIQKTLREMGILQKQARNIMIMGGSRTAYYLAKMLTNIGNSVKIIEKNPAVAESLGSSLPKAVVICGDGTNQELLLEEGLRSVDAFLSLTGIDEENILMSIFASSNNVPKVIAKVNSDELASLAENLGLDCIVSPRKTISDVIVTYARALRNSLGSNVETLYKLVDGGAEALEFNVCRTSKVVGVQLKDLKLKSGILIAGILRDRRPILPNGDDMILEGDRVVVISSHRYLSDLSEIIE
ncbi:MAG: Trk system potassium transporter TrkA [Clostridiales bacterium]|nr:Trk system potassium transporter TrkA [Clostridiales bacterium]